MRRGKSAHSSTLIREQELLRGEQKIDGFKSSYRASPCIISDAKRRTWEVEGWGPGMPGVTTLTGGRDERPCPNRRDWMNKYTCLDRARLTRESLMD
ncbi:hypothetical protein GWI33_007675 [Rhynchophorus ferrugineus]|uniref:Uncharacterized protein n=1 Tax=Rhynchophorus ferrugineus TaxID=354439 RepID=A0A834IDX7_RHYFE|nr:hypothetical protein GWI33_007675 [Rhynchophorus ferrugineus]